MDQSEMGLIVRRLLVSSMKELKAKELKEFHWELKNHGVTASEVEYATDLDTVHVMEKRFGSDALKKMVYILKMINHKSLAEKLEKKQKEEQQKALEKEKKARQEREALELEDFLKKHKLNMKEKTKDFYEGMKEREAQLNEIYTELFITEGDIKQVNCEHEILNIDEIIKKSTKKSQGRAINCNEMFTFLEDKKKIILTKGIAGIGKTVSVQKFILDWAEDKANKEIGAVFLFTFKQINQMKNKKQPIRFCDFLQEFYPEIKRTTVTTLLEKYQVVFIFDGLDESLELNFDCKTISHIDEPLPVDKLFINLIRGHLIPSSLIWITSRPAAIKIPPEFVGLFTEIRGFNDQQKEEYFTRKIQDKTQADKIIKHVKISRSLYILCHIPLFCWITVTVLQDFLNEINEENIDTALTEMYIHFLLIQMNVKSQKYEEKPERNRRKLLQSNKTEILQLAKIAFEQLKKENIIFYEEDLEECGIDVLKECMISKKLEETGMIAEIFKKEAGLYDTQIFSFVDLSVRDFLAALHVFICYIDKKTEDLAFFFKPEADESITLHDILFKVIDKSTKSERGHLDLFLRFLVGMSLESNQRLLKGLLTAVEDTTDTIRETTEYIKQLQNSGNISDKASVNLFYCLLELKDKSLYAEIQRYLRRDYPYPEKDLSSSMCTLMVHIQQMSEEVLDEFKAKEFKTSQENYRRLVPAVRRCKKALLSDCNLTVESCEIIASYLQSSNSPLRELDLSNNDLRDSGVNFIFDALNSPSCQLHTLRLSMCNLTGGCCEGLSSCLQSSNSPLTELDLSNNDLQDSGVKKISDALKSHNCQLHILRLSKCNLSDACCEIIGSSLQSPNSPLTELDLSNNDLQDSGVKLIFDALKSHNCQLQILRLSSCNLSGECCEGLSSCLQSSNSPLRELDLSNNDLQDSGVNLISDALKSHNCQLHILRLSGCMVTDEGCSSLASALNSNLSHLIELDLSYNHPQQSGNQLLSYVKYDGYPLKTLKMENGGDLRITAGPCKYVYDLTLDPNTAHCCLILSEENKAITHVKDPHPYPDDPERFEDVPQVLCREGMSERCYWEAEWSGSEVHISVSYKSINRKGESDDSLFGFNKNSWSLICTNDKFTAYHNNYYIIITSSLVSKRVGVYVDWLAGTLSFFSVSDTHTLTHLHTFNTKFTEDLYAGFRVSCADSSVSLCQNQQTNVTKNITNTKMHTNSKNTYKKRMRFSTLRTSVLKTTH